MGNDKISVLLSIYNETEHHIRESVESILSQSYENFEVVIVIDNPLRKDIEDVMASYNDNRIRLSYNEKNIGLAESMNKALLLSEGEYIARMDADDVAMPNRFEVELNVLKSGQYDLVCSHYVYIDENSYLLDQEAVRYTNAQLVKWLPFNNTIHHPTVMMTREAILRVNGYRNFPCSQDYDLWLRMLEAGCRFFIIDESLLKYRIRKNSITESKSFKQIATIRYIKKLYDERKNGMDSYSLSNYNRYINALKLNDPEYLAKCERDKKVKEEIAKIRNTHKVKAFCMMLRLFLCSDFYRMLYVDNAKEVIQRHFI